MTTNNSAAVPKTNGAQQRVFGASADGGEELLRELAPAFCSNTRKRCSNRIKNATHASRPES